MAKLITIFVIFVVILERSWQGTWNACSLEWHCPWVVRQILYNEGPKSVSNSQGNLSRSSLLVDGDAFKINLLLCSMSLCFGGKSEQLPHKWNLQCSISS